MLDKQVSATYLCVMTAEPTKDAVRLAAEACGGFPQLAEKLGIQRQALYQWDKIPADRVVEVERVSGISRTILRPDLFEGLVSSGISDSAA